MFQPGEIVLYRLFLAQVDEIKEERYILHSLESDDCYYEVPLANKYRHLQALPDCDESDGLLKSLLHLPTLSIPHNAVDRFCKSILDSYDLRQWLMLLKTLFIDKINAESTGRKFVDSKKYYYKILFERMITIFSFTLHKENAMIIQNLNAILTDSL